MSDSYNEFQDRVARIYSAQGNKSLLRKNTRAVYVQGQDGYTVIRGREPRRPFPWSGLVLLLVAFFMVKGAIMANMGPEFYTREVAQLEPTTVLEHFRVWTMGADPVSSWVAQILKSLG
ncbi:hypothetical protein [Shimia sediminis]|uniref:hypothetical protein n=1 Tax=Shimia sediminis TaxID=2497945 RepID=UPI000F8EFD18|nr:hypothetical protein [Shimia sediminis]